MTAADATATDVERDGRRTETGWHARSAEAVADQLDVDPAVGLSPEEAARRREEHGPNELAESETTSPLSIFVSQFRDVLVLLLFGAVVLSLGVGLLPGEEPNYVDATLILAILLANGVFGFVQDYRAEQAMAALRELASPDATVVRGGERLTVDATAVVPGDVVLVEQGDAVPADARLVSTASLETDEAALTGESTSVAKDPAPVDADAPLAERSSLVYTNTNAVRGRGRAVVVATGMDTEVGAIATRIQAGEDEPTPFQREVDRLGRQIGAGVVALVLVVTAVQVLFTTTSALSILLVAITLAVAAVPEGLPAVVTLTLALGSRKLLARNALVRRLPVVESLGSVDVVVTDKTGTLTESQMTVERLWFGEQVYEVTGTGLETTGEFRRDGESVDPAVLEPLLRCGAVCNDAGRAPDAEDDPYYGDPTEVALLVAAEKAGIRAGSAGSGGPEPDDATTGHGDRSGGPEPDGTAASHADAAGADAADHPRPATDHDHPERLREIPFSSERKRMTVVVDGEQPTAYVKGAPEVVVERCDRVLVDGTVEELTDERRAAVRQRTTEFAEDALRVLAFARKAVADPDADEDAIESDLVLLGLQGMIDPPREEVPGAVADCRRAGIRVVMVTGDNGATARAVGEQVGFDPEGALTGREVARLSDDELREAVESVEIFARASPDDKVRILEALQANDHVVAMTGDGVNDAPALRNADVGVSMGIRGTDVAQQASDVVLRDDNFATIRDAVAEGRGIFDNVRKFVNYLLSANAGEVLVVFAGVLVATALFPSLFAGEAEALVLTPVMLLWINLVTDGLPALALGADPKADDVMDRPPRPAAEGVIDTRMVSSILAIGAVMAATGLALFLYGLAETRSLVVAQTLLFTFLVVVEMVRVQVIRSRYDAAPLSNPWLLAAVATTLVLQLLVLYTPLADLFGVVALALAGWAAIAVGFVAFLALNLGAEVVLDRTLPD